MHAYSVGVMGPVLSILILLNMIPFVFLFFKRGIHKVDRALKNQLHFRNVSQIVQYFTGCVGAD